MAQPVITTVSPTPAEPRMQLLVIGTGFGFVNSAFFEQDPGGELFEAGFTQVFDGEHVLITVPPNIATNVDYNVVLVTIEDEASVNNFGTIHVQPISGSPVLPTPLPTPDPFPLPALGSSVGLDRLRKRVRLELGDAETPFQAVVTGDGDTTKYDLPVRHVETADLILAMVPAGETASAAEILVLDTDYLIDSFAGEITLPSPLDDTARLFVTGRRHRFFSDEVLDVFIETAFVQITHGRLITTETLGNFGYRVYANYPYTYDTLPEVEILPTALLAKIEALWVLATDAAYEVDISEDGANIPRSERYRQLMAQIQADTARFNEMAEQLNIGLSRIEMDTLRRTSYQTGRLVPVYVGKEYDDHSLPVRVLPGIDHGVGEGTEFVDPYYQAGADYGGGFGP